MNIFSRLSIRIKLVLLSGVPVIGALVLAAVIAQDARHRAATAAALGSIEDLAQLSSQMSSASHALQRERAYVALREGYGQKPEAESVARDLPAQYAATDVTLGDLEKFLAARDLSKLPPRLARDLATTRTAMTMRQAFRAKVSAPESVSIDEIISFYGQIDEALISATAGLAELSDDGELLRSISSLVALAELTERSSAEHALLANVFASGQFPPGAFKTLVTNVTEQTVYTEVFRANAADEEIRHHEAAQGTDAVKQALELRGKALTTTDDSFDIDAQAWFAAETARHAQLGDIEKGIMGRISAAASRKVAATRASIRLGVGLSAAVVIASALLAWIIARGVTRTVSNLASAAARVRETKDFGIRATKTSTDDLGMLTDAFNEMLSDIQARDSELEGHRTNLEAMVAARTEQLAARNDAMRLVLDNVDQGLATIHVDGTFAAERSAAFDRLMGAPPDGASFAEHIAHHDPQKSLLLSLGWEMVVEDVLPLEVSLDQLPKRMTRDNSHFTLDFKPILDKDDKFDGALLVLTDVTSEVNARAEQEKQREFVAVFEHVAHDRDGFGEFAMEVTAMLDRLGQGVTDPKLAMAIVHTVKGNAAQWGVFSVAQIAHELETQVVETNVVPSEEQTAALLGAWKLMTDRVEMLVGGKTDRLELTRADVDAILRDLRMRVPHETIADKLERLKHEPTAVRFSRMAEDIERLAKRVDKPAPKVVIESNGVRLPASRFGSFWASTVHVVRNLMDHGIESADVRVAAGKTAAGTVVLRSVQHADRFTIELEDDGHGIDWEALAAKASEAGMPTHTRADLERALFASGVSTAAAVTELSGRGVGLSAVAERCTALGGRVDVVSKRGHGTRFVFDFPRTANERSLAPAPLVDDVVRRAS